MAHVNEHYLKLAGAYLFPEIARRVKACADRRPDVADRIIRCGIGDVPGPIVPAVASAMHDAIDELASIETFRGYPPATGYDFLREAIAEHDFRSRGAPIDDDEIFVSDGSKGDCGHFLEILGPNNIVGLPDPVYPVYVDTNVMAGRTGSALEGGGYEGLRTLPATVENGFVPEPPDEHVDIAYLCFPNNPTGSMIDRPRLEAWVRWANEHDAIILYDAAYADFIRDPSKPRSIFEIPGARTCAVEFRSFSKHGAFTGVRCGYTVVPKELEGRSADREGISLHSLWTRRWTTRANGVSWPVQCGAAALYTPDGRDQTAEVVTRYMDHARLLADGCRSLGWQVHGGEDAPFVWTSSPGGEDSWSLFERILEEAAIVVTPGVGFGRMGEGFIRISAFNTRERIDEVVDRLGNLGG
ncbi:MAG: LL-diaminopimelate aminotransferase [Phycisphaerae bacterium]|nr:LL-diaminopimelate aminotransferase [Phycisphaerae bacterium]